MDDSQDAFVTACVGLIYTLKFAGSDGGERWDLYSPKDQDERTKLEEVSSAPPVRCGSFWTVRGSLR